MILRLTLVTGIQKIYALGFKTKFINPTTYYIDDKLDSDHLVLSIINELLRPKYSDIIFFTVII